MLRRSPRSGRPADMKRDERRVRREPEDPRPAEGTRAPPGSATPEGTVQRSSEKGASGADLYLNKPGYSSRPEDAAAATA